MKPRHSSASIKRTGHSPPNRGLAGLALEPLSLAQTPRAASQVAVHWPSPGCREDTCDCLWLASAYAKETMALLAPGNTSTLAKQKQDVSEGETRGSLRSIPGRGRHLAEGKQTNCWLSENKGKAAACFPFLQMSGKKVKRVLACLTLSSFWKVSKLCSASCKY